MAEPRTVRAYWGQAEKDSAAMITSQREDVVTRSRCAGSRGSTVRDDPVDQQGDEDRRKGQLHVGDAHDDGIQQHRRR